MDIEKANLDTRYLKLDQSTSQTLTASPILNWGTATRIPFYASNKTLTDSTNLVWDNTNAVLTIGGMIAATNLIYKYDLSVLASTSCQSSPHGTLIYGNKIYIGGASGFDVFTQPDTDLTKVSTTTTGYTSLANACVAGTTVYFQATKTAGARPELLSVNTTT